MKSLVVYYTRTGNAKFVAETIAANIGADVEEVVDLKKRDGKLGYLSSGSEAFRGKETQIADTKFSPKEYDLIVVGTPVWAGAPTPAIRTYLNKNDLSGKKVALFFTQGGKKPQGVEKTKVLMPNSEFVSELSIINASDNKQETAQNIIAWCKTLPS
jgi:flavodoxin